MLLIRTSTAKRFRKYSVAMVILFALSGAFASFLTMHWYVAPTKK
jgi:hypothetical protein